MTKVFVGRFTTISNIVALQGNLHRITLLIDGKAKSKDMLIRSEAGETGTFRGQPRGVGDQVAPKWRASLWDGEMVRSYGKP